jgi:hypothetical protein
MSAATSLMCIAECRCGCRYDVHAWKCLAYVGRQDDGAGCELILRNCGCGSTIAAYASEDDAVISDDREDFADEWAMEDRRERELENA